MNIELVEPWTKFQTAVHLRIERLRGNIDDQVRTMGPMRILPSAWVVAGNHVTEVPDADPAGVAALLGIGGTGVGCAVVVGRE